MQILLECTKGNEKQAEILAQFILLKCQNFTENGQYLLPNVAIARQCFAADTLLCSTFSWNKKSKNTVRIAKPFMIPEISQKGSGKRKKNTREEKLSKRWPMMKEKLTAIYLITVG